MTLELCNVTTSLSRKYSREFVGKALELARLYGWRPRGTYLHEMRIVWLGRYLTNDGQTVFAEDACSLEHALARAMDDIPNESKKMDWNPKLWRDDDLPEWLSREEKEMIEEGLEEHWPAGIELHPLVFFAGNEKLHLKEFIRFCRLGSFTIF